MQEIKVNEIRYFKDTILGSKIYFSLNPFLDNSIACKIGFQLNHGMILGGKSFIEKNIPDVRNNGL